MQTLAWLVLMAGTGALAKEEPFRPGAALSLKFFLDLQALDQSLRDFFLALLLYHNDLETLISGSTEFKKALERFRGIHALWQSQIEKEHITRLALRDEILNEWSLTTKAYQKARQDVIPALDETRSSDADANKAVPTISLEVDGTMSSTLVVTVNPATGDLRVCPNDVSGMWSSAFMGSHYTLILYNPFEREVALAYTTTNCDIKVLGIKEEILIPSKGTVNIHIETCPFPVASWIHFFDKSGLCPGLFRFDSKSVTLVLNQAPTPIHD
jgi:hypothetical protein